MNATSTGEKIRIRGFHSNEPEMYNDYTIGEAIILRDSLNQAIVDTAAYLYFQEHK